MKIKKLIKHLIYPISCLRHGITIHDGFMYIGKSCKFVNAKRMTFGNNVSIMPYSMLVCLGKDSTISMGRNTELGMFSRIGSINSVEIGNNVLTGPHVFIADYNHEYKDISKPIMSQGNTIIYHDKSIVNHVIIGDDSWLGTNVVIAGNVRIGKHCVIGANSVVTHDIPDYCVAAGNPCRIIKQYDFKTNTWERIK